MKKTILSYFKIAVIALFIANFLLLGDTSKVSAAPSADAAAAQAEVCVLAGGSWNNEDGSCLSGGSCAPRTVLGIPPWYKYLTSDVVAGKCKPRLDSVSDALPIGLAVLEALLTLGGLVAVVMVFIGGFQYVLSQGESDRAAGGRKTAMNAVIGLVIIILATRVVSFIGNRLG